MDAAPVALVFFSASITAVATSWILHRRAHQQINRPPRRDASAARIGPNTDSEAIDGRS